MFTLLQFKISGESSWEYFYLENLIIISLNIVSIFMFVLFYTNVLFYIFAHFFVLEKKRGKFIFTIWISMFLLYLSSACPVSYKIKLYLNSNLSIRSLSIANTQFDINWSVYFSVSKNWKQLNKLCIFM